MYAYFVESERFTVLKALNGGNKYHFETFIVFVTYQNTFNFS